MNLSPTMAQNLKIWKIRLELAGLDLQLFWVRLQLFVFS
jgi:hypothetical protein